MAEIICSRHIEKLACSMMEENFQIINEIEPLREEEELLSSSSCCW
jgi:hypothetical protein